MVVSWDRHLKNGHVWKVNIELSVQGGDNDEQLFYTVDVHMLAPTQALAQYIVTTMCIQTMNQCVLMMNQLELLILFARHIKDATTKLNRFDTMFVAFALSMMVLSPILMYHLSPSGDSMEKR